MRERNHLTLHVVTSSEVMQIVVSETYRLMSYIPLHTSFDTIDTLPCRNISLTAIRQYRNTYHNVKIDLL